MRTPHLIAAACTSGNPEARHHHAELAIWDEWQHSLDDHPRIWSSPEEGATVLGAKVDDLWNEVRANHIGLARAQAAQVGAMAVRFIADLYEHGGAVRDRARVAAADAHEMRSLVGPGARPLSSSQEGFGFLRREYDALWSAVRFEDPARQPAARVAAMAARFVAEISNVPFRWGVPV